MVSGRSFGSSAVSLACVTSMFSVQCFRGGHSLRLAFGSFFYPHPSPRLILPLLKGQCPDYAHARASSVFSSKDNRTVILTRQDFLPDRTADRDLLFIFSSNILDFRRSLSSYIKIWLAVRRLIVILSLAGPPRDPKISFRSL